MIAGQIPLIPASMTMPVNDYHYQAVLALQHVQRIWNLLRSPNNTGGGWDGWVESCTAWYTGSGVQAVSSVWEAWAEQVRAPNPPGADAAKPKSPRSIPAG